MPIRELFWDASPEELMKGYASTEKDYTCLICERVFTKGVIYQGDNCLLEACLAIEGHIAQEHGSIFDYLLALDKKFTGLTEVLQNLMSSFYKGESDREIAASQGISSSTVRNHRFKLKERERQARVFLALMGLLKSDTEFIPIHKGATMVDDRYAITSEEEKKILNTFFQDGKLISFPAKQKRKLIILRYISALFESDRTYTEKEINQILQGVFPDFVTLRRYLVDYGFLERNPEGSKYHLFK